MDITMCAGGKCPLKEDCLRHKGKVGYWQSYFIEIPYKKNNCKYFIKLKK